MKTKIVESVEWIAAYAIDYVGKILLGVGAVLACFAPLFIFLIL